MSILSKASLVQIPSGYKEDKLYSEVPNTAAGDFQFTRASTGTRVNSDGYIEEVPWNKAQYSQDFANSYWSKQCDINSDTQTSPIASNDADEIVETNTNAYQYWYKLISLNVGIEQTFSVYVKYIDCQYFQLTAYNAAVYGSANFDLINKTHNTAASFGSYEVVSANIEELENDWMRVSMTFKSLSSTTSFIALCMDNNSSAGYVPFYNGTGLKTAIWGFQWNRGTIKPYIKITDRLSVPRLDYSGGATCPTLLLEPQRTNTIVQSEDLSIGTILSNATVTTDQTTSPDSTDNADKVTYGSGSGFFYKQTNISAASTYSVFLKYDDYQYFQLMGTGDVDHYANFDILNGTVGNVGSQSTASIEDYGNGWYRCILNMIAGTFAGAQRVYKVSSLTSGCSAGGGGAGSVFAWGLQLESGAFATSYIPTLGTSVTRNAEACYVLNNTDVIGQEEGVVFIDFVFTGIIETYSIFKLSQNASSSDRLQLYFQGTQLIVLSRSTSGGAITQIIENPTTIGKRYKVAIQYKDLDFKVYLNGSEVYTNTSAYSPDGMNQVTFSNGGTSTLFGFFNDIKQLFLFKEQLTDTELEELTTI